MTLNDHYVIIGNGPAGNAALDCLRKNDPGARITIISDEAVGFYYKPKLCGFIAGTIQESDVFVNAGPLFDDTRIRLGQHVESIDPDKKILFLSHKEKVHYTKLIIASGSKPGAAPWMEPFRHHLKTLTCFHDAVSLKDAVINASRFVILGGDLVGFTFIKMLVSMGKKVTLILYPGAFWPFPLDPAMVDYLKNTLTPRGIHVLVNEPISTIQSDPHRSENPYTVCLQNHPDLLCDLVFSFSGMTPNVDFACTSGFDIDHGILVDEYLRTGFTDIYACGSCAQIYNPGIKAYHTTIGWPNARKQGEMAALNLLGAGEAITSAPRKYFDLEGIKIKTSWWEDINEDTIF